MAKKASIRGEIPEQSAATSASRTQKSSIPRSKVSPSAHQLSLFPSGVQILDSQDGRHTKISRVDESRAVILNGGHTEGDFQEAAIAVSDDEAEEENDMVEESVNGDRKPTDQEDEEGNSPSAKPAVLANGVHISLSSDSDVEMDETARPSAPEVPEEVAHKAEPSFGDLLAATSMQPISIAESFPSVKPGALIPTESSNPVAIPSGISLSTVLTQALRTNDNNLLESCFHNTDTQIIRSTIQRIDSSLAGILIQKLAERLSSRPGRHGHLLVWVQWICVAHGGAIGGQPDVSSKVKTLYKVLNQRSKALDSLLLLKGKLDMLDAQLGLRKQLLADRDPVKDHDQGHLIYIEGEEDSDSSNEDAATGAGGVTTPPNERRKIKRNLHDLVGDDDEESGDDEDMPTTNGIIAGSEESDFDSEGDEDGPIQQREGGLVDDEADESDEDSHPSDREDEMSAAEDVDDNDEEDSEMDDFIDDGPVEEADTESDILIDEMPEKPPTKKHRQH